MSIILIFIFLLTITIGYINKNRLSNMRIWIFGIHLLFLILIGFSIALLIEGFRFRGIYTNTIISIIYFASGLLMVGFVISKITKAYLWTLVFPFSVLFSGFYSPTRIAKMDDYHTLEIHRGGFLAPPNIFYVSTPAYHFLIKRSHLLAKAGFSEITNVQVIKYDEELGIVTKIYHSPNMKNFTIDTLLFDR